MENIEKNAPKVVVDKTKDTDSNSPTSGKIISIILVIIGGIISIILALS